MDDIAVKSPPELREEEQLAKESEIMFAYIEAEDEISDGDKEIGGDVKMKLREVI